MKEFYKLCSFDSPLFQALFKQDFKYLYVTADDGPLAAFVIPNARKAEYEKVFDLPMPKKIKRVSRNMFE